jgi:hypothetical protein
MKDIDKQDFCDDFLREYMKLGIGSMPKSDIDALVLILIDKYGSDFPQSMPPQNTRSNQEVSETLRTPVSTIKRLRYQASLKFGGPIEDQIKIALPSIFKNAAYEIGTKAERDTIKIMVENTLLRNWMHGQLKAKSEFFDTSFNSEIIRLRPQALEKILKPIIDASETKELEDRIDQIFSESESEERKETFKQLIAWLPTAITVGQMATALIT